jgi:transposase-like protein
LEKINKILSEFHSSPAGGHLGIEGTFNKISCVYEWENMRKSVMDFVGTCKTCQKLKIGTPKTKMPLKITTTSSRSFQKLFLDIVGPFIPSANQNKYILSTIDDLTKYTIMVALPNQETETIAKAFATEIICRVGVPETIVTDCGSNFMSKLFTSLCKLFKIEKFNTNSYHPMSNSSLERTHRTVVNYLRCFVETDPENWDTYLPMANFSHNTTVHTSTGFTPFELLYGTQATLPTSFYKEPEMFYDYDNYLKELKARFQRSLSLARENTTKCKTKSKIYYDKRINSAFFHEGDKVLLINPVKKHKLDSPKLGPYVVMKINNDLNSTILVGNKLKRVHNNRLILFRE